MDLFCKQNVIHGDCLEIMRGTQANSIDCILTDPPYGLSFMGKHWDKGIPDKVFWAEALRVCKPGAMMLAFGGARTYHRLACEIEDASWEIRDCLMWLYGSGFPKGKSCLKPAWEPIILCRKKGIIQNLNIDECRIATYEIITNHSRSSISSVSKGIYGDSASQETHQTVGQKLGRWPSNLLLDEESAAMLDEQSGIIKSGKNGWNQTKKDSGMWRKKKELTT